MSTLPPPPVSWLAALENKLPQITARLRQYFRRRPPELREEMVQEALVQLCTMLAGDEKRGHDTQRTLRLYWGLYTKRAAYRIFRGSSCTRHTGQPRDPLDQPHFSLTKPRAGLNHSQQALDVQEWCSQLPPPLQATLLLLLQGHTQAEIGQQLRCSRAAIGFRRIRLQQNWSDFSGKA